MESTNDWIRLLINGTDESSSLSANITYLQAFSRVLHEYQHDHLIVTETRNVVLVTLYVLSFLVATTANTLALLAFCRYRHMRQLPNILLVTLAIADLMVALVCMPMAIGSYTYRLWIFGELMCKLSNYFQAVAVTSSIFTMTVMSLDRYVVICHPIACRRKFCRRHVRRAVLMVWILAAVLFIPVLIVRTTKGVALSDRISSETLLVFCIEYWQSTERKRVFGITVFVLVFFTPGMTMGIAYFRIGIRLCEKQGVPSSLCIDPRFNRPSIRLHTILQKRRLVAKRFVILTTVFAACWIPYNLINFLLDCQMDSKMDEVLLEILPFGLLLGHANSSVNPILYCWLNRRFRWCLLDMIKCRNCGQFYQRYTSTANFQTDEDPQIQVTSLTPSSQSKQKSFRGETVSATLL